MLGPDVKEPIMETADMVTFVGKEVTNGTWMKMPFWIKTIAVKPGVISGVTIADSEYLSGSCLVESTRKS